MAENPRTTSARDHDDRAVIDAAVAEPAGGVASTSGGKLADDVGTQDELRQNVTDPGGRTRPTKQDDIDNNVAYDSDRRGANKQ